MAAPLSAIDAVSPAFQQAKRQLFQPFRFGVWARLAVVGLATGEFATGGGGGFDTIRIPVPEPIRGRGPDNRFWLVDSPSERFWEFLPLILAGIALLFLLWFALVYIHSIFRFVLLDSVLTGRCALRESWRRWQGPGRRYFLWQLGFALVTLVALAIVIGGPVLLAWRAGLFRAAAGSIGLVVLGVLLLFLILLGFIVVTGVIAVLAKDFLVPLMALEELGALDAWRRLLPLLAADKWGFAGYVLMKIVLAVGSAILFGILDLIVLFVLAIPLGIAAVAIIAAGGAAGLTWNAFTIGAAVLAGLVALAGLLYLFSFVSVPAVIFFQAYTVHFFGGRYPPLGALLVHSPAPAAPESAPLPAPAD